MYNRLNQLNQSKKRTTFSRHRYHVIDFLPDSRKTPLKWIRSNDSFQRILSKTQANNLNMCWKVWHSDMNSARESCVPKKFHVQFYTVRSVRVVFSCLCRQHDQSWFYLDTYLQNLIFCWSLISIYTNCNMHGCFIIQMLLIRRVSLYVYMCVFFSVCFYSKTSCFLLRC